MWEAFRFVDDAVHLDWSRGGNDDGIGDRRMVGTDSRVDFVLVEWEGATVSVIKDTLDWDVGVVVADGGHIVALDVISGVRSSRFRCGMDLRSGFEGCFFICF